MEISYLLKEFNKDIERIREELALYAGNLLVQTSLFTQLDMLERYQNAYKKDLDKHIDN